MTITDVRCRRLTASLHAPFVTALRTTTMVETVVVEIVDTDRMRGFGEAPQVWRVTGESLAGAEACILGPLRDVVVGRSPDDLTDLLRDIDAAVVGNPGAKGAIDVALHDLAARRLEVSMPRYLGTTRHDVRTDVTVAAGSVGQLTTDSVSRIAAGFDVLKLKVGTDAESDVAGVCAVRRAVGPDVRLRVDANQGWTARQAIRVIRTLEDAGANLEFVEQPVRAHDLAALAQVTAAVDTPVLADEAVFGVRDLSALIEHGAADLVNIKLAKCGGLAAARTMLDLAAAHGVGTIVGSMMESPIGVAAAASLVASRPTSLTSDLDAAWWLSSSPVLGGLVYDTGTVRLPDSPGLGIDGLA